MFALLAVVLVVGWLFGFFVFHVSAFAFHVLLVIAAVAVIMQFVRRGRPA